MTEIEFLTGAGSETSDRPAWSVDKFDNSGQVRRTPGLTTLCHIDPASDAFAALTEVQATLRDGPHSDAFSFLPVDSFHMTVWDGVIDYRRCADEWPDHLPISATLPEVEADFAQRLGALYDRFVGPSRFVIRATDLFGGFSIKVTGADAAHEAELRATRDRIADALGWRRANHDAYQFHVTLAYQIRWLDCQAAQEVIERSAHAFGEAADRLNRIEIGPIEFCRFETMHRFDPIMTLNIG